MPRTSDGLSCIRIIGARQHNLKNLDVSIPRGRLTVITGPSGSGKSTLAFDTLFAEGQRKYVESLSAYARQFLEQLPKADVERIEGLAPTIAIEQRVGTPGPRSTVATSTEIYDYLRVLFARAGRPTCWICGRPIARQSVAQMVDAVFSDGRERRVMVLAPVVQDRRGGHQQVFDRLTKQGFVRGRINGQVLALDEVGELDARRRHTVEVVVDRLVLREGVRQRLADSVELAARTGDGRVVIAGENEQGGWADERFSAALCCPDHPEVVLPPLNPNLFSFNSPSGACPECHGLGTTFKFDPELVLPDPARSLAEGAILAWHNQGRRLNALYAKLVNEFCEVFGSLPDAPFRSMPDTLRRILLHGTTAEDEKKFRHSFEGVLPNLQRRWQTTESDSARQRLRAFLEEATCPVCHGSRLRPEARAVRVEGRSLPDVTALTAADASEFFEELSFAGETAAVADPLLKDIRRRLGFLQDVGVGYLGLDRASSTLSGGEWQRIRLATQIGSGLAGVCYVLDEPTIGLHPRDSARLADILGELRDMGNTLVVVEHDAEVIRRADHLIDIGPGAGERGGRVVAEGPLDEVLGHPDSVTARFLSGRQSIALPDQRRAVRLERQVYLRGVTANNLKSVSVAFPVGCFVSVTGVSGSGKSTLVSQVLVRALRRELEHAGPRPGPFRELNGAELIQRVVEVDQAPIGRTSRSNPATYVGVFNLIRGVFARTRTARIRGFDAARFSFNTRGGRCESCEGQGVRRVSLHFLPDVFVTCSECGGARYNRETLEIRYRGKSIADVLALSVDEAILFFDNFSNIRKRLQLLKDVGLGYIPLGQSSSTLSGGEAQRIKLAAELQRGGEGHTLYILDEPTTGLHFVDVRTLLSVLQRLVDRGNTVLCVEHNLDVIKVSDWVIDLGPEGGAAGGSVVAAGTPEQVAAVAESHTGRFLVSRLRGDPPLAECREQPAR